MRRCQPARGSAVQAGLASRSTSTLVVVLPAGSDSVCAARVARAVAARNVVAVYTTDNPAVYHAGKAVHTEFGGSLIPYEIWRQL